MPTKAKQPTSKPQSKMYIAFDMDDEIMAIGELDKVQEQLEQYIDEDASDVEFFNSIRVYEVGKQVKLTFIPAEPVKSVLKLG